MTDTPNSLGDQAPLTVLLASQEARLARLEDGAKKHWLKVATENAGVVALFLGLILTFASLYDVFVAKPEADRISAIGKFNDAVNSAARTRQELMQVQAGTASEGLKLAMGSMAAPRILSDIATARAILPSLRDKDVGVPQLIVIIGEALNVGDLASAEEFVRRAVAADATPYLHSEAKRYEGRLLFLTARIGEGRVAFEDAMSSVRTNPLAVGALANVLADWTFSEYLLGDCSVALVALDRFATAVNQQGISVDGRSQLTAMLRDQLTQWQGQHCPKVERLDERLRLVVR